MAQANNDMTLKQPIRNGIGRERFGLMMIGASLLVVIFITGYMLKHQRDNARAEIRHQGTSMVRLLSNMPLDNLVPEAGRQGVLQVVSHSQGRHNVAYAAVDNLVGERLAIALSSDVAMTAPHVPTVTNAWMTEQSFVDQDGNEMVEFVGPVLDHGQLAGYLRIGYRLPGFMPSTDQLPLLATLAFAVFLLTILFHFLIKREIKPINAISHRMQAITAGLGVEQDPVMSGGELRELTTRFTQFIDAASRRIESLEDQKTDGSMSNKLLVYQKTRIEAALQALPEAVVVVDESGIVTYGNPRISTLLGLDLDQVVGHRPQAWCQEPSVLELFSNCQSNMARTFRAEAIEFSPAQMPGAMISVSAHPLFSASINSAPLGTLFVFRDISEEASAKRARGEFVAHVAHELKTPLNVIQMYSETLQDNAGKDHGLTVEASNVIHDEVERLSTLISNLLSMTQIEMGMMSLDRQRTRLNDLVEDAVDNLQRSALGKGLGFTIDVPRDVSSIYVDKDLLRIAINNLLTNAIKYNRPDGSVAVALSEDDDAIRLSIKDTGIGISPEDQLNIFEKFYRSESHEVRERTGHGLGLALAHQVVSMHHGELTVQSELHVGTEFIIRFAKDAGMFRQAI